MRNILCIITFLSLAAFSYAGEKQKLFFCSEHWNPKQQEFVKNNKINNMYIIYQNYILDTATSEFDEKLLKEYIEKMIPEKNKSGYAVLDVEEDRFLILRGTKRATDKEYQNTIDYLQNILRFAKSLRPHIKWSYFGFNFVRYPELTSDYAKINQKAIRLYRELDFLAPALYLQDKPCKTSRKAIDVFINSNVQESVKLGIQLNKPVYLFVWNRYHNAQSSNTRISYADFSWYVNKLLQVEYNKKKADGIMWWNSESYIYRNRDKDKDVKKEFENIKDEDTYQINILQQYFNSVKPLFR